MASETVEGVDSDDVTSRTSQSTLESKVSDVSIQYEAKIDRFKVIYEEGRKPNIRVQYLPDKFWKTFVQKGLSNYRPIKEKSIKPTLAKF